MATSTGTPPTAFGDSKAIWLRRAAWQLASLVGLSAALGFAFNTANPTGVRFESAARQAEFTSGFVSQRITPVPPAAIATTPTLSTAPLPHSPPAQPTPQLPHALAQPPAADPVLNPFVVAAPPVVTASPTNLNPAPIHWLEAKPMVAAGQAMLVDVRPRAAYDAGHIPDAISLPETSSPDEFKAFLKQVPTDIILIAYCSSTSCSLSQRVATRLVQEFHWGSVRFMTGGYQEYQREELAKPQSPNAS